MLDDVGAAGPRLQKRMDQAEKLIGSTKADSFDQGLVELGKMLGWLLEAGGGGRWPSITSNRPTRSLWPK